MKWKLNYHIALIQWQVRSPVLPNEQAEADSATFGAPTNSKSVHAKCSNACAPYPTTKQIFSRIKYLKHSPVYRVFPLLPTPPIQILPTLTQKPITPWNSPRSSVFQSKDNSSVYRYGPLHAFVYSPPIIILQYTKDQRSKFLTSIQIRSSPLHAAHHGHLPVRCARAHARVGRQLELENYGRSW